MSKKKTNENREVENVCAKLFMCAKLQKTFCTHAKASKSLIIIIIIRHRHSSSSSSSSFLGIFVSHFSSLAPIETLLTNFRDFQKVLHTPPGENSGLRVIVCFFLRVIAEKPSDYA